MKKLKLLENQKGTSLIEVLLYTAITSVMVVTISSFMVVLLEANTRAQTISEVNQQGTQLMQSITQTIRNSTQVNSPAVGATSNSLSVNTTVATKNPTIFDISGREARIKEGAGQNISLTSNRVVISNLSFQNLSNTSTKGTIRVRFTLTHVNPNNKKAFDYSQTFYGTATIR